MKNRRHASCPHRRVLILILCLGLSVGIKAQLPELSLAEAEEIMRSEHPELKLSNLSTQQTQVSKGAIWQPDPLQLQYQRGQMNTLAQDNYLGITQDLGRPWLAWAERSTWQSRTQVAQLKEATLERELRYRLRESWYYWQAINAQAILIKEQVQSLLEIQSLVKVRVEAGADNQVALLQLSLTLQNLLEQQIALQIEQEAASLAFQQALGWEEEALPQRQALIELPFILDTSLAALEIHPLLTEFEAKSDLASAMTQVEKAKLGPGFQIGYFSQSIDGQRGFDGFNVGLSVPLIFNAQSANRQIATLEGDKTEIENDWQRQQIRREIENLRLKAQIIRNQLEILRDESLPIAQQLRETTLLQYRQGATDYFPVQQAIQAELAIRKRYLQTIAHWNETINRLNYWLDV
ncbi:MAG: TolC family protein [Bacteroidia bacterium]